ncbi:MAG: radical SAM protein [Desulfosporosinus sp.]|nr:radical SAM protein [Desulfosporosinus sp.]
MKVLFIQPYSLPESLAGDDTSMFEPLALEYLAAGVKDICQTQLLDMRLDKSLEKTVNDYQPDVIGITGYSVHVNTMKSIIKDIRLLKNNIKFVLGGHHASVAPKDFFDIKPDYIICGEGVYAFRELILSLKGSKKLTDIDDVEISTQQEITILKQISVPDLDNYPFPDRELSSQYRQHYFSYWLKPVATLRSSAGCKFKCTFCSLWETYKGKYFIRKPENILKEIMSIEEKTIYFCDDESFLDPQNIMKLATLLKENGVKKRYHMMVRADTVVKNKEVIAAWQEIGLERVFIGVEGYNDSTLKKLNKGTTTSINEEAIKYLQSLGVSILTNFIIVQDFELKDFIALRNYIRRMKLSSVIFTVLTPLPGTQFYREVEDKLIDRQFEHIDVMHSLLPTKLPLKQFYKEIYKLYKESSSIYQRLRFISQFELKDIVVIIRLYRMVMNKLKVLYETTL